MASGKLRSCALQRLVAGGLERPCAITIMCCCALQASLANGKLRQAEAEVKHLRSRSSGLRLLLQREHTRCREVQAAMRGLQAEHAELQAQHGAVLAEHKGLCTQLAGTGSGQVSPCLGCVSPAC